MQKLGRCAVLFRAVYRGAERDSGTVNLRYTYDVFCAIQMPYGWPVVSTMYILLWAIIVYILQWTYALRWAIQGVIISQHVYHSGIYLGTELPRGI